MDGRGARRRRALARRRRAPTGSDRTRVPRIARGVCITKIGVCIRGGKCTPLMILRMHTPPHILNAHPSIFFGMHTPLIFLNAHPSNFSRMHTLVENLACTTLLALQCTPLYCPLRTERMHTPLGLSIHTAHTPLGLSIHSALLPS